jgi:hypothetical protein
MSYTTTVFGTTPADYFTQKNIDYIKNTVSKVFKNTYSQQIIIDDDSVKRVLRRVFDEKLETVDRMNQRAVMYLVNGTEAHLRLRDVRYDQEQNFKYSQSLYDPLSGRAGADIFNIKLAQRYGKPLVGGTLRFYHT